MSDQVHTPETGDRETTALAVGAGGILAFVCGLILDSGLLRMLGLATALVGGGLYARGKLAERGERIEAAETAIRSELDELDPVARAQVLAGLTRSELSDAAG